MAKEMLASLAKTRVGYLCSCVQPEDGLIRAEACRYDCVNKKELYE